MTKLNMTPEVKKLLNFIEPTLVDFTIPDIVKVFDTSQLVEIGLLTIEKDNPKYFLSWDPDLVSSHLPEVRKFYDALSNLCDQELWGLEIFEEKEKICPECNQIAYSYYYEDDGCIMYICPKCGVVVSTDE